MRYLTILFLLLIPGCTRAERAPPPTSTIKTKHQAIEPSMGFDPFDRHIIRQRTTTVYYFVDDEGKMVEVDLGVWMKHKEGDSFNGNWK